MRPKDPFSQFRDFINLMENRVNHLAAVYGSVEKLAEADADELSGVDDIGPVVANDIRSYFEKNADFVRELLARVTYAVPVRKEGVMSGQKVVLTGTLQSLTRSKASELIEAAGGAVQSSVTGATTLVVAGENAGSKLAKARAAGVRIIGESEFLELLNA